MSINLYRSSTTELYFSDHIKGKICMGVESASVRLQLLKVSTYHQRLVQYSYLRFGNTKTFFGRIFIVEFVSELQITTWRRNIERLVLISSPILHKDYQVKFCYLFRSTYNSTVSFGPSAFSNPNNALRYTELGLKTSVTPQSLQHLLITQNSL